VAEQADEDMAAKFSQSLRFPRRLPAETPTERIETHPVKIQASPWAPVPDWARFFIALGSAVAVGPDGTPRIVAAVSTPCRAYAAALCACGVVLRRSTLPVLASPEEHFAFLRALPPSTTVTIFDNTRKLTCCSLIGYSIENGEEGVWVRVAPDETRWVPARQCLKIQVSGRQLETGPKRRSSRRIRVEHGLLAAMLPSSAAADYLRRSRLECAIVGRDNELHEEIHDARFAIAVAEGKRCDEHLEGCLQDVLRVKSLVSSGEGYRSDVFPASRPAGREARASSPAIVIFDGASSFLKWSDVWPKANWVAIIDRADYRFEDARSELNRLYVTTRAKGVTLPEVPAPPSVESMVFGVGRR